ncbi:MAG TPA: hypothetical protein VFV59_11040 [Candidatus Limnocylindria bacterium]|nr:hypothetical protein [Candidatus Limnocylindria bacterium]
MALLAAAALAVTATACGGGGGSPSAAASSGGGGGDATSVDITLQEWAVVVGSESAPAGQVTFNITNDGPEDVHEFVIFRTDLDPGSLPTDEHGAVDEEGEGLEVIDEVEDVAVGATEQLTVDMDPGSYVLVCNIYSEDEDEAHYQMGMRSPFEVTD